MMTLLEIYKGEYSLTIEHDEEAIESLLITGVGSKSLMRKALRDYHEHMTRWRTVLEPPEIGQWIVLDRTRKKAGHFIEAVQWNDDHAGYVAGSNNVNHWTWKPLNIGEP